MATLGSIRRIPSRVNASGYIFRSTFRSLSEVLCSDECRAKKAFQHVKRMLPLFRAVVEFCTVIQTFHIHSTGFTWLSDPSTSLLGRRANCLAVRSLQSIRGLGTTVLMCVFNVCITCFVIVVIYFSLIV